MTFPNYEPHQHNTFLTFMHCITCTFWQEISVTKSQNHILHLKCYLYVTSGNSLLAEKQVFWIFQAINGASSLNFLNERKLLGRPLWLSQYFRATSRWYRLISTWGHHQAQQHMWRGPFIYSVSVFGGLLRGIIYVVLKWLQWPWSYYLRIRV